MHIGLVGGIGPAATDYYYQRLIRRVREAGGELELTMAHADSPTLLRNLVAHDDDAQVGIYGRLAARLAAAGADVMAITSIAGHFCIEAFDAVSPLPVASIITIVDQAVSKAGYRRVGILGTRVVMETKMYGGIKAAEVLVPEGEVLATVDRTYLDTALAGVATSAQSDILISAARGLCARGAEAILLGGTDLVLVMNDPAVDFDVIDCAGVHADHLAELALGV